MNTFMGERAIGISFVAALRPEPESSKCSPILTPRRCSYKAVHVYYRLCICNFVLYNTFALKRFFRYSFSFRSIFSTFDKTFKTKLEAVKSRYLNLTGRELIMSN